MSDIADSDLKRLTARSVKWNVVDKVLTQALYALTGIILARLIAPDQFGLLGAVLVFQSFATIFIDSGFGKALLQRKEPTDRDYSTVFWFNMAVAVCIYGILWLAAPLIDAWFHGEGRLIPLARASFLTFVLSATGFMQTSRMIKQMNMRPVALANCIGLALGGAVGIGLALWRADAWALVWQQIATAGFKSLILWLTVRWRPAPVFSRKILRSFLGVGSGVMLQSFLNIVFQNVYSFFIGNRLGFRPLGIYTQADKWSKMAPAALEAILGQSLFPALAAVQDQPERFAGMVRKMHRATASLLFIGFGWMIAAASPIFHLLLGEQWDAAIPLFQLLILRAMFTVPCALYCNFMLAVGHSRRLVINEAIRDGGSLIALVATMPLWNRPDGLEIMIWGQVAASALTFVATIVMTAQVTWRSVGQYLTDLLPFIGMALIPISLSTLAVCYFVNPWAQLGVSVVPLLLYPPLYRLKRILR